MKIPSHTSKNARFLELSVSCHCRLPSTVTLSYHNTTVVEFFRVIYSGVVVRGYRDVEKEARIFSVRVFRKCFIIWVGMFLEFVLMKERNVGREREKNEGGKTDNQSNKETNTQRRVQTEK